MLRANQEIPRYYGGKVQQMLPFPTKEEINILCDDCTSFTQKVLMWPYPLWKVLFPGAISTLSDVGLAMINATLYGYSKQVLENSDIAQLARTKQEAITL
jgi:hypothetical protein